jgi:electron transfer flavoprotein beta subunit
VGLKILVPVKRVVDPNVRIRVRPDGTGVDLDGVKMSMNPFDEIAVEEAVTMCEDGKADEVLLVSVGPAKAEETLRTGLAMGADRAILVETGDMPEPLAVAKVLKAIAEAEGSDLILMGKQAIDDDCTQTGQMLAALLGIGQATFASKIEVGTGEITVTREVDGGLQTVAVSLPAVVTADLRLNQPRSVSLPNVMKAKRKPLEKKSPADYGVDTKPRLVVVHTEEPAPRRAGVQLGSVADLVDRLRNEAKVL